jgi:hypothetical protein
MAEANRTAAESDEARFCARLARVKNADSSELALGILCWHDLRNTGNELSAWDLTRIMTSHGLASPNRGVLATKLSRSGFVLKGHRGFRLKAGARDAIREQLAEAFDAPLPEVNLDAGYLPHEVWKDTRGYLEKVCLQLNGCYQFGFHDACSVMVRRALETLIIEAYEHLHRESEIRDADGNYFMLGELVNRSMNAGGLSMGREAKSALK